MQLQRLITSGESKTVNSSASITSETPSLGPAKKRRLRKQKQMAHARLVAAGLMPEGTTSTDLPAGFGTKSPTPSVIKFCESGQNKRPETAPASSTSAVPGASGSAPELQTRPPDPKTLCDLCAPGMVSVPFEDLSFFADLTIPPPSFGVRGGCDASTQVDLKPSRRGCHMDDEDEWGLKLLFSDKFWTLTSETIGAHFAESDVVVDSRLRRVRNWIRRRIRNQRMTLTKALAAREHVGPLYIECKTDCGRRWAVNEDEEGNVLCVLEDIPACNTNVPGHTNAGLPFDRDEQRPSKVLVLSPFMEKIGLPFVDLELYYELKKINLNAGTSQTTHRSLSQKADVILNQTRVSQYDPHLLLEVKLWTVAAAMLPLKSEVDMLSLMGKKQVFKDINAVANFKRDGVIQETRFLGLWTRRHVLTHE